MKTTLMNPVKAFTLFALGLAIAAMGIYVATADDAPGAAVIGMLLMVVGVVRGQGSTTDRPSQSATWFQNSDERVAPGGAAPARPQAPLT